MVGTERIINWLKKQPNKTVKKARVSHGLQNPEIFMRSGG